MSLTKEEINFLIKGYTEVDPDYQMSAWALRGLNNMDDQEITDLHWLWHNRDMLDFKDTVVIRRQNTPQVEW